ncbi:MAG TPA: glycosyltransferase family 2 protein [Thermoleophilaceae bacterium]|jgi:GT2 family glycosyltransferase
MRAETLPVTVVIPAYRRPDMVERAVRSVLAQRRRPCEILVVDDASGDETGPRAAALGARVITHEHNLGEGGARNTGIRAAGTDWVALLDCDDEWLPDHLDTLWSARDGHVLVGTAVLGTGSEPDHHRVYGWRGRRPRVLSSPAEVALPETKVSSSTSMVRRAVVLDAGGFRPLKRAADLDLWIRVLEHGSAVAIPRVTALYHMHPGQVSDDAPAMHRSHKHVLDAYRDRPWCTPALLRRHEGVVAWDSARGELQAGRRRAPTLARLAARLAHPQRAIGVAQLLVGRFQGRRLAARVAPGGGPSVALLPGAPGAVALGAAVVDLRDRGTLRAFLHLARCPTGQALASSRTQALALRVLSIEPLREPPT